jgi:hypothetical protein
LPRHKIIFGDDFPNQLKLERILSEPVTLQLIEIHQSQKMQDMGYLPIVHRRSWEFEQLDNGKTIKCNRRRPATSSMYSDQASDYIIDGDVGVVGMPTS